MESQRREDQIRVVAQPILGRILLLVGGLVCLWGDMSPPQALAAGLALALLVGNPHARLTRITAQQLLQISVVALGFSMDLHAVSHAGLHGFWFAAVSIAVTWMLGFALGRWLRIQPVTAMLVTVGTAICGGSAIAAVGSVIVAGEAEMSAALGTVFLLNAVALYVFPLAGHYLGLSQTQFGTWAGVAIHDISSVVGAAAAYGHHALQVATAVKLSRALWIVPVALLVSFFHRRRSANADTDTTRIAMPWFIALFLVASLARTLVPAVASAAPVITTVAERGLTLTLFLIGAGLSRDTLRAVGLRPMVLGMLLWAVISVGSLVVIRRLLI